MGWTKDRPTKPGKYAAIHLVENHGGFGQPKLISIVEDLQPPPSKNPLGFDWERHDAPIEEWIKVLIAWETGGQGPTGLGWYTWFFELNIDPVPREVEELLKKEPKSDGQEEDATAEADPAL